MMNLVCREGGYVVVGWGPDSGTIVVRAITPNSVELSLDFPRGVVVDRGEVRARKAENPAWVLGAVLAAVKETKRAAKAAEETLRDTVARLPCSSRPVRIVVCGKERSTTVTPSSVPGCVRIQTDDGHFADVPVEVITVPGLEHRKST